MGGRSVSTVRGRHASLCCLFILPQVVTCHVCLIQVEAIPTITLQPRRFSNTRSFHNSFAERALALDNSITCQPEQDKELSVDLHIFQV